MELGQLKALLDLLRENGITKYKDGNLELELGAAPASPIQAGEEDRRRRETPDEVEKVLRGLPSGYEALFTNQGEVA